MGTKINQSTIETIVDGQTGEVIQQISNQTYSYGDEPSFIKLYLQDVLFLSDMPTKHSQLMYELLKRSSYATPTEGMTVTVNASVKRRIAAELGITNIGSINNALTDLVRGHILYRIDTGLYSFNPNLFGKGDWQNISRLRLQVNYDDIHGKTFNAVCAFEKAKKKAQADPSEELPHTGTEG